MTVEHVSRCMLVAWQARPTAPVKLHARPAAGATKLRPGLGDLALGRTRRGRLGSYSTRVLNVPLSLTVVPTLGQGHDYDGVGLVMSCPAQSER
jgi:hypothetical protein